MRLGMNEKDHFYFSKVMITPHTHTKKMERETIPQIIKNIFLIILVLISMYCFKYTNGHFIFKLKTVKLQKKKKKRKSKEKNSNIAVIKLTKSRTFLYAFLYFDFIAPSDIHDWKEKKMLITRL